MPHHKNQNSDHHHHGHHHGHGHSQGHSHEPPAGRVFVIGITLNLTFVIVEFFYGLKINSLALIADAGHNLSDVAGLLLAWAGMAMSRKSPTLTQSYGFKKASILAALANSLFLLIAMGSLMWEAILRFQSPRPTEGLTMMTVAGVGILVNGATALMFAKSRHHDLNMKAAYFHMLTDAFVSLGVVIAGILTIQFQWFWIDPLISVLIAALILFGTFKLFRQSLQLAFDGVPEHINLSEVKRYFQSLPGVRDVFDLHIWALSSTQTALTVHLHMPEGSPGDPFLKEISESLQDRFHIQHPTVQIIQNPDVNHYCH